MDAEIKAMGDIAAAMTDLEPEQIRRVLRWANERWANERFQVKAPSLSLNDAPLRNGNTFPTQFGEFHELFDAAKPNSGLDKVLVAAYWYQVLLQHDELDSQDLNKELKDLGYPSTNITRDLDHLINRSPRLITQLRKEGKHKQGRRRYKLTREGIRAVEKMLAASGSPADEETSA